MSEPINPETIETLKKQFPGMSKPIFSLTRYPEKYGIDLTQTARKLAGKKPKVEEHRNKPCRLYVRLDTRVYSKLTGRLNGMTVQDYLEGLVRKDLKEASNVHLR